MMIGVKFDELLNPVRAPVLTIIIFVQDLVPEQCAVEAPFMLFRRKPFGKVDQSGFAVLLGLRTPKDSEVRSVDSDREGEGESDLSLALTDVKLTARHSSLQPDESEGCSPVSVVGLVITHTRERESLRDSPLA